MSAEKQTTSSSQTSPWAPQAGALTTAFGAAQNAYGNASQATAPTNFTAQFTPDQLATFRSMQGYANGNTTPGNQAAAGNALTNAGVNGTTGALSGLASFDPTKLNNSGTLIDQANQYVAGQDINGQVANAMLPAIQQARDVTMPGIEQNAATSGNTNSTRTGIADGLVQRGLAEQSTNLGATLRNNAFTNGLTLAAGNANSNNSNSLGALTALLNGGTNAASTGVNAGSTSINNQGNLFSMAENAGQGQQAADQADLTNQQQQYQSKTAAPYDALKQLMSIIGTGNWGSSSTGNSTESSTPSAWSVLGGLLGAAGSAAGTAGTMGWKPFS